MKGRLRESHLPQMVQREIGSAHGRNDVRACKVFRRYMREKKAEAEVMDILVCASGLEGCSAMDSFQHEMASSNSSTAAPDDGH